MREQSPSDVLETGVNILGDVFTASAVGEQTRQLIRCVREAGIPYSVKPFISEPSSPRRGPLAERSDHGPIFDLTIVGVDPAELPRAVAHFGKLISERYTIALWLWDQQGSCTWMAKHCGYVNEIWANSSFSARVIVQKVLCPVLAFPLPIEAPPQSPFTRTHLGLPEGFLFLLCLDLDTLFEQINPIAAVDAFGRAFRAGESLLVIQTVNGHRHTADLEILRRAVSGRDDIIIIDRPLSSSEQAALMRAMDAYVSLHRADGFGLTLGAAMALGKPVIATAYSGNLDFMSETNSFLVPYDLSDRGPGSNEGSSLWVNPNIEVAAKLMRLAFERRDLVAAKVARARDDVEHCHSPQARARFIRLRLDIIRDLARRQRPHGATRPSTVAGSHSEHQPTEYARALLDTGPEIDLPTRWGPLVRLLRRCVFRLFQNYHVFLHKVLSEVLSAIDRLSADLSRSRSDPCASATSGELKNLSSSLLATVRTLASEKKLIESHLADLQGDHDELKLHVYGLSEILTQLRSTLVDVQHLQTSIAETLARCQQTRENPSE